MKLVVTPTYKHHNSQGFKLYTPDVVIGYTADTLYFQDMAKTYADCDVLIVNNVGAFGAKRTYHMISDDTVKLLNKIKPKLTILNAISTGIIKRNPIYEAREIEKLAGCKVVVPEDGERIDLAAYSAEGKQKHLLGF